MKRSLKKIFVVSGSWPPAVCGVGDFMDHMYKELARIGFRVQAVNLGKRDLVTALRLVAASYRNDQLVYISYPTEGYGKSLLPFLLVFGRRAGVVVHIHEYSSKNKYGRFLLRRFKRLKRIYFSNEQDIQRYLSDCGRRFDAHIDFRWQVMPSPSNIPISEAPPKSDNSRLKLVHFGQIRPHKGLEQLSTVFELLDTLPIELVVIGGVPSGYEKFADELASQFRSIGAVTKLNLSPCEISVMLADAEIGIFPFPDGADERRGSLIAALAHGVLCITTHSERTPKFIKDATIGVDLYGDALERRLADAVFWAASNLESSENLMRMENGQKVGRSSSFHHIAKTLTDPYSAPLNENASS